MSATVVNAVSTPDKSSGQSPGGGETDQSNWKSGLLLVAIVVVSAAGGYALGERQNAGDEREAKASPLKVNGHEDDNHVQLLPHPELSASDVVQIQLDALAKSANDPRAAAQVFAFASAANQAVTGPLEDFAAMLTLAPYEALVNRAGCTVGREIQQANIATLLVTTVDNEGHVSLFRFLLSRHLIRGRECWVTDAVLCLAWRVNGGEAPDAPPAASDRKA